MRGITKVNIHCNKIKYIFCFLFILLKKFLMYVLFAALPRDIFAIEIMRFDYGFTVRMKVQ